MGHGQEDDPDQELDDYFKDTSGSDGTLAHTILALFAKSVFDVPARDFMPEDRIKAVITRAAIQEELGKDSNYLKKPAKFQNDLVSWIHENASKLFVITLQCDLEHKALLPCMHAFKRFEFHDSCLPIDDPRTHHLASPSSPSAVFQFAAKVWTDMKLKKFFDGQWSCLAPVFTPDNYDYDLPSECIFPFTWMSTGRKGGAFSTVYRATVHPEHQKHPKMQDIALKELKVPQGEEIGGADNAWEYEAGALKAINKLNHDHIVKCIAAIRRGDSRYFMFPWADGDSLRDYWDTAPREPLCQEIILQIVIQLRGLADALHHLHNFDGGHSNRNGAEQGGMIKGKNSEIPDVQLPNEHTEVDDYENAGRKASIRHGDVKPENILRFTDPQARLGVLKLADMGLAKRHVVATQVRRDKHKVTSTRYGTRPYEAPETVTELARSRLYDIWSMGCITLEFIIWILYGNEELNNFYTQIAGNPQQTYQYYEIPEASEPNRAQVHRVVRQWMNHIREEDPECSQNSAIQDLLKIVREKLLIVPLPPDRPSNVFGGGTMLAPPALGETVTRYRATAEQFRDALDDILKKSDQPGYLFTGKDRSNLKLPKQMLSPLSARNGTSAMIGLNPPHGPLLSGVLGRTIGLDYSLPPMKDWQFSVDNVFAEKVATQVGADILLPNASKVPKLCNRCSKLDFWTGGFAIEVSLSELLERAQNCQFCRMLRDARGDDTSTGDLVRLVRNQSNLVLAEDPFPVLSIFRAPESRKTLNLFQLGFPELPTPGSDCFFDILKLWLEDCDTNHRDPKVQDCRGATQKSLPTRLIDVGDIKVPNLRLVETREEAVFSHDYIALSHPWGDLTKYTPFTTLRKDISGAGREIGKFKQSIPYDQLPATFKDAVKCTRRLGVRYLWIDSLCIIQGEDGDFTEEAKTMGNVFSGAYCVLAASRAEDQRDGFLGPREPREYITFQHRNESFYICKPIDNFNKDVIEGSLNKRGWVLQERALARRTIYFTATQTYFECGGGVRCETLTKMHNNMADFLGDPRFPEKAMRAKSRALRIEYFQGLYKLYSRLNFTRYEDRPFAIAGLEKSLQGAFATKGGFGIFDDGEKTDGGLFHRSLLWKRSEEDDEEAKIGQEARIKWLKRIDFPAKLNVRVPSWSWMAYKGAIDYTDPHYQTADWEDRDIVPPWTRGGYSNIDSAPRDGEISITATVRDFTVAGRQSGQVKLTYDTGQTTASDGQRAQCVVIAKSKEPKSDKDKRYFVLLVAPTQVTTGRGEKIYQRLGAGFMLGRFITLDGKGILAKII